MATVSNDVDAIRRDMAQIRQRLHQDMQGVVAGAEAASDWKHYVRMYPWAALGGAFVLGYLVIPRRRRSVTKTAEKAAEAAITRVVAAVEPLSASVSTPVAAEKEEKKSSGWFKTIAGMLTPIALKYAQSYALGYVENWIAQQAQAQSGPPEDPPLRPGADAMSLSFHRLRASTRPNPGGWR